LTLLKVGSWNRTIQKIIFISVEDQDEIIQSVTKDNKVSTFSGICEVVYRNSYGAQHLAF